MTKQTDEIIEYRGRLYSFKGLPLDIYLKTKDDVKFSMYSTAHWRGYQGFWRLENDKLFLTKIQSANLTLLDIFNTEQSVLAEWYSGSISIGIGEPEYREWFTYYEHYLWIDVNKGIVQKRKIIKSIESDFVINFGKYKGKRLSDVLRGKIDKNYNLALSFQEYIQEVFNFFKDPEYRQKIITPYFEITDDTKLLATKIRKTNLKYLMTQNFLAIEKFFYINSSGEEDTELFSQLLERIFTSNFSTPLELAKTSFPEEAIAEQTLLLNPDFSYLNWALKTVEKFSISPDLIAQTQKLKVLKKFKINRLNSTIFEYTPDIETIEYNFSSQVKEINLLKFQKEHQVIFDSDNNIYLIDLPLNELLQQYGHYLDESFISKPKKVFSKNDSDEYRPDYFKYKGAHGYDDNAIDNAFEGDPDNYWNID